MRTATPREGLHDWPIDGSLMLLSFFVAIPSSLLSGWLVLNWVGVHVPNDTLWFVFVFLAAVPAAPAAFGLGAWAAWRRPVALAWLAPASIYWVARLVAPTG